MRQVRVTKAYRAAYSDAMKVRPGDVLTPVRRDEEWPGWIWCTDRYGKGAWVPESYVERHGESCTAKHDYDSTELSVGVGAKLTVIVEEAGWLWCVATGGEHGWIPTSHTENLPG